MPRELLETLHLQYTSQPPVNAMFPQNSLPAQFLESIVNCAKTFSAYQRNAITRNIELFENSSKGKRKFLFNLRQYIAEEYIRRYDVTVLEQSLFVVPRIRLNGSQLYCWPEAAKDVWHHSGHHTGCYQERMQMTKLNWQDRVVFPHDGLNTFKSEEQLLQDITCAKPVHWLPGPSVPVSKSDVVNWTVQLGKPITKIDSSRFCPSSLIDELNEARLNATVLRTQEGQRLMEKLEQLAHEKLRVASGMTSVLRNSNLLGGQTNSNFVDISGDCRFICGLVESEFCMPAQCCGLFCRNCASPPEVFDTFDGVNASSCLSYKVDLAGRVKSLVGRTDDEVAVVCGSVFSRCKSFDGGDELSSRPTLVNQCLTALGVLEERDSFVCEISDTLTQFTVGVIYILHQLFQQVSLCPAVGKLSSSPTQFLVCQSYSPSTNNSALTDYMAKILEDLDRRPSGKDLITLVPISRLFSEEFYQYLRTHTTNRVRTQLDCIVNLERLLLA